MAATELLAPRTAWRTPLMVLLCGCAIAVLSFGPRSVLGFFLTPMSLANGWSREVFGMALAIQNLLWGLGLPFAGAIADRYGTVRVLWFGGLLYALGLALMAYAQTPGMLNLSAGVLIGFGKSGCSFNIVLAAFGKLVPNSWRSLAFGAGTAAGSFGQFLFSPLTVALQDAFGWQTALLFFAAGMLLVLPFAMALSTPPATATSAPGEAAQQSMKAALAEALGHRFLQSAGARVLHLRVSTCLHHDPYAGLSNRPRPPGLGRGMDHRGDRALQHDRLARLRLARRPDAETLHPLGDLSHSRGRGAGADHASRDAGDGDWVRRGDGSDVALHRPAHQRPRVGDVRDAVARRC